MKPEDVKSLLKHAIDHRVNSICPDKDILVPVRIGTHFVERLLERFSTYKEVADALKGVVQWIDDNYCMLLFDANLEPDRRTEQRVTIDGYTAVLVIYDKTISLRTIWKDRK